MKITKKVLSVILAMLMIASCTSVAFAAQSFSGIINDDQTISSGASISDDAVFNGNVTISNGAYVSKGTFNKSVTNNGTISGGNFKGTVTNYKSISDGSFNGSVTNAGGATISGGTFNSSVTNASNATIKNGTFKGSVTNNGEITTSGYFYGLVTNNGKISSFTLLTPDFYNVIVNNSSIASGVSAIIKTGNAYTVQGSPTIKSKVTLSGKDATFTHTKGTIYIDEGGQLDLNCSCTINATILLSEGAKLTSNGGSLVAGSNGTIKVPLGASFSGTTASKFDVITYREHNIKVESNVDASQFNFSVPNSAYRNGTVTYTFDLSGSYAGCLTLNSVTVYKGRKGGETIMNSVNKIDNFTMPDTDVVIFVDCTANHAAKTEHKDATCTANGYDKTVCTVCNHTISETKLNALGHSFSAWERNTNPNSKMLKSRTCTRAGCGHTEKSYIEIIGYDNQDVTVDYKSTLTFNYNVSAPDGCYVQWKKGNGNAVAANPNGFTVSQATEDFTVTAVVLGAVNDTYTVNVHVKHGFFDKLIAFFRGLFNALPVYVNNVKQ